MRKTINPEEWEYSSTLGRGYHKTNYGCIRSYSDGDWYRYSLNKQWVRIGERWVNGKHEYDVRL